jgi:hypothetical protein
LSTKKDLELNDSYLNALVENSRRNDVTAFNDFAPLSDNVRTTAEDRSKENTAFTLITQIAFPLQCRCGYRWTYKPRACDPRRKYALCCKCRQAVKIHKDQPRIRTTTRRKGTMPAEIKLGDEQGW